MIAEYVVERPYQRSRWTSGTTTTSGDDPPEKQQYSLSDALVRVALPPNDSAVGRGLLATEWRAVLDAFRLSFADLVSQSPVTRQAVIDSPADDSQLLDRWELLLNRYASLGERPVLQEEEELLDWDMAVTKRPTRVSTKIYASVRYRGRAKPSPVIDPWD